MRVHLNILQIIDFVVLVGGNDIVLKVMELMI
jgi:hypothetical protein